MHVHHHTLHVHNGGVRGHPAWKAPRLNLPVLLIEHSEKVFDTEESMGVAGCGALTRNIG